MPPRPSRANQLDAVPVSSEEEAVSGIHVRPTRSAMPPLPLKNEVVPTSIAALLAETLDDVTEAPQEDGELDGPTEVVVQASLPPQVVSPSDGDERWLPPPRTSSAARVVALVSAVVAVGFAMSLFVTRPPTVAAPTGPRSTAAVAAPSVVALPKVSIPAAAASVAPVPSSEPSLAKPPPTLADGEWMLRHREVQRAEAIYRSILASGASECEALTGLGKVSLANRRPSEAQAFFERALARQPQYFPARLGRADALWDAGRRDAAKAHYAAIREGYSDNAIPPRVVERTR